MILSVWTNIWEFINKVADSFKDWIIANSTNPVFYIGLFFIGILVFTFTYRALHKD